MTFATSGLHNLDRVFTVSREERNDLQHIQEVVAGQSPIGENSAVADVRRALQATGYLPLRNLEIEFRGSFIWLRGVVPSYHLKQMAQSTVQKVAGVERVVNAAQVVVSR
ncbi:MAG: BON domain-containing protein [Planctomycetia bacterium]|nr:BON domain-containing protein [Planctomycetia bacterium]